MQYLLWNSESEPQMLSWMFIDSLPGLCSQTAIFQSMPYLQKAEEPEVDAGWRTGFVRYQMC
jgi:hypothetical protein